MLYTAGVGGAVLALTRFDEAFMERTKGLPAGFRDPLFEKMGDHKVVRPVVLGVFATSLVTGNHRFQDAAFTSLQAYLYAGLITNALKGVFGRARPYQDEAGSIRPFSGNTSLPSGHSTTAFAVLTPWALYYPSVVTPALFVLSASSAFSRITSNKHWFTDVVAGSSIGFATAYGLTRRHQQRPPRVVVVPALDADAVGLRVRVGL